MAVVARRRVTLSTATFTTPAVCAFLRACVSYCPTKSNPNRAFTGHCCTAAETQGRLDIVSKYITIVTLLRHIQSLSQTRAGQNGADLYLVVGDGVELPSDLQEQLMYYFPSLPVDWDMVELGNSAADTTRLDDRVSDG